MANKSNELSEVSDEAFAIVARELATGGTDEALWTKAFALQNGNEAATKAHYIRLRVEQITRNSGGEINTGSKASGTNARQPVAAHVQLDEKIVDKASLWSRLWARNIDFLICMALYLPATLIFSMQSESLVLSIFVAFLVPGLILILYDAFCLSTFGKTAGKALFGIRVTLATGENLPFSVAWKRAFKVWIYGNSGYFFFPTLTVFAWWMAKREIRKSGTSSWDAAADSCVTQSHIGNIRNGMAITFGVFCFASAIAMSAAVKYMNKEIIRDSIYSTATSLKSVPAVTQAPNPDYLIDKPNENVSDLATISKKPAAIIVGLDDNFPPMGFRTEKNELVGFDVDLAVEAAKRLGAELTFKPIDWNTKEAELNGKRIDVLWNGLTITEERKANILFTTPYLENRQIIVVLDKSPIKTKAELAGKVVGVQDGSAAVDPVQKARSITALKKFADNVTALMDLSAGRFDALVVDEVVGRYYTAKVPGEYRVLDENFGTEDYGVGTRKDDTELMGKLQKALDDMKKDGSAAAISTKWFGKDIIKQ